MRSGSPPSQCRPARGIAVGIHDRLVGLDLFAPLSSWPDAATCKKRVQNRNDPHRDSAASDRDPGKLSGDGTTWIASSIWGIAADVLRDLYVSGKYRDVILSMTVLRWLEAVPEPTKQAVIDIEASLRKWLGDTVFISPMADCQPSIEPLARWEKSCL